MKHRPLGGAGALLFVQASLREAISVPLHLPIPIPSTAQLHGITDVLGRWSEGPGTVPPLTLASVGTRSTGAVSPDFGLGGLSTLMTRGICVPGPR